MLLIGNTAENFRACVAYRTERIRDFRTMSKYMRNGGNWMTTASEYREYAAECLQTLRFTTSPEVKAALLLMAERWEKLAEYVERAAGIKRDTQHNDPRST